MGHFSLKMQKTHKIPIFGYWAFCQKSLRRKNPIWGLFLLNGALFSVPRGWQPCRAEPSFLPRGSGWVVGGLPPLKGKPLPRKYRRSPVFSLSAIKETAFFVWLLVGLCVPSPPPPTPTPKGNNCSNALRLLYFQEVKFR